MTKKELLLAEIEKLDDEELEELGDIIRAMTQARHRSQPSSLMSRLKRIKISGPRDFAANHDYYANGDVSATCSGRLQSVNARGC